MKSLIKNSFTGKFYDKDELKKVTQHIISTGNTDCATVAQHIHYSTVKKKYYFSLKCNKVEVRQEYVKILQEDKVEEDNKQQNKVEEDNKQQNKVEEDNKQQNKVEEDNKQEEDKEQEEDKKQEDKVKLSKNVFIKSKKLETDTDTNTSTSTDTNSNMNIKTESDVDFDTDIDTEELLKMDKKDQIKKQLVYSYPSEQSYNIIKRTDVNYGPYGTQHVHDKQFDDKFNNQLMQRADQFVKLRNIVLPDQRSAAWFAMRDGAITASDGGCVLNQNKHDKPYMFIIRKCFGKSFTSNEFCYHGKKLEEPATMIYAYRMNVQVEEFGLMMHPTIKFLGASPDGICSQYKLDGVHKSKYVGRMLEIKCPFRRKIKKEGPIKDWICPIYYWVQVQLQLECCDLEECDFWQCEMGEYKDREEFLLDTDVKEPFRSKQFGYEKGCLIQLVPKSKMEEIRNGGYLQVVYDDAIFIYPEKIEMTPYECDMWVAEKLSTLCFDPKYSEYSFDRVIYWRLQDSCNVTIQRDREWFAKSLPQFEQMWRYVAFYRQNAKQAELLRSYVENCSASKSTKVMMELVDKLTKVELPWYKTFVKNLEQEIEDKVNKKVVEDSGYMFDD